MRFPRALAILAALSLLAACSSPDDAASSSAPDAAAAPEAAPEAAAEPAPPPAANTCALAISADDAMKFDTTELKVAADCTEVTLTLMHSGKLAANMMGHNWVLTKTADMAGVAADGMTAGPEASFVPAGDARVIAHTKVIGGGETTSVTFPTSALQPGGDYSFFCSFPGHSNLMKGKLVFG